MFPYINEQSRTEQKASLRKAIRKAKRDQSVINDSRTELRKLVLPNDLPISP